MPRFPRIEYAGALYHVTSRGNARQVIFHTDADHERFLSQLKDNLATYEVGLYAFVLMKNHYHLLVRTKRANLSRFIQRLNTSYALYYRYKHDEPGHVFQGRYTAKLVDGDDYAFLLIRYIHLNPVKIKAVRRLPPAEQITHLERFRWSSYPGYVRAGAVLDWVDYRLLRGYGRTWSESRRRYRAYVYGMIHEDDELLMATIKASAHAVGDPAFIQEVEKQLKGQKKGDDRDRDVTWPAEDVALRTIDELVAGFYGMETHKLKEHGHRAGEAKRVAMELAVRKTGKSMREIGAHYGGMTSAAISTNHRKIKEGGEDLRLRIAKIEKMLKKRR